MVRVRLLEDGPRQYRNRSGVHVTEDDPELDVDEKQAAYLVDETGYFEFIDPDPRLEAGGDDVGTGDDGADQEDEPPDEAAETKHSVVSAPEEFTVEEIKTELETGEWDDYLETLEQNEEDGNDRSGVTDAIKARRED